VALIVQKYGGSSLESADRIRAVAERIVATKKQGNDVVVVCSAMGDTTDELLDLAAQVNPVPPQREMDMLLTAGERISNALVAMAVESLGAHAQSFTGSQAGVLTTERHGNARIVDVTPGRLTEALDEGKICIVAGFQGVNKESRDVTTLGRGGSDTTAVALAAALNADVCEIYSDVDGVYTADPRIVPDAQKLDKLSFEEMLEMAAVGSKILVLRSVEYARAFNVPLRVRSSYSNDPGTLVTGSMEDIPVEEAVLTGVATDKSEAKVTVLGIPDRPGEAAKVFRVIADAEINIDMVLQNVSSLEDGTTDITFTCPRAPPHRGPHPRQRLRIVTTPFHSAVFFVPPLASCTDSLDTYSFALLSCVFSGTREETPLGWDRCQRSHGSGSPAECHVDTSTPPGLHLTCSLAKHRTRSSPHRLGSV